MAVFAFKGSIGDCDRYCEPEEPENSYSGSFYRTSLLIPEALVFWHVAEDLVLHPELDSESQGTYSLTRMLKCSLALFLTTRLNTNFILILICK